jgi:hypothetical protein
MHVFEEIKKGYKYKYCSKNRLTFQHSYHSATVALIMNVLFELGFWELESVLLAPKISVQFYSLLWAGC